MKNSLLCLFSLTLCMVFSSCSKDEQNEDAEPHSNTNTTPSSIVPKSLMSGDKLYEINQSGKHIGCLDILSSDKLKSARSDGPCTYEYRQLTDSTAYFSFSIDQATNLYMEYYTRKWVYKGELKWSSKTHCRGSYTCYFTSSKYPSETSHESQNYEFVKGSGSSDVNIGTEGGGNENPSKYTNAYILAQIKLLQSKKNNAERQLAEYMTWTSNATVIALINSQRALISMYDKQIAKWQSMLNS